MPFYAHILLPLDGSHLSEMALKPALALARAMDARLTLLRAVPDPVTLAPFLDTRLISPDAVIEQRRLAENYLRGIKMLHRGDNLQIETVVSPERASVAIIRYAMEQDVNLIVISSHGGSGLGRWTYGSVANRVIRGAPCATLIVQAAATDPLAFGRILVPLDGSAAGEGALEPTLAIASAMGSETILFRVTPPLQVVMGPDAEALLPRLKDQIRQYLQRVQSRVSGSHGSVEVAMATGPVARSILEYAAAQDVDLIAITTHGFTGDSAWAFGSVAEKVVRGAQRSVLVLRTES